MGNYGKVRAIHKYMQIQVQIHPMMYLFKIIQFRLTCL